MTAQTETLTIEGMSCQHCISAVRSALDSVPGATVHSVEIGRAEVSLDSAQTDRARLAEAVEDAGFDVVEG